MPTPIMSVFHLPVCDHNPNVILVYPKILLAEGFVCLILINWTQHIF